jgi:hypothetical protein
MAVSRNELELLFSRAEREQRRAAALVAISRTVRDLRHAHTRGQPTGSLERPEPTQEDLVRLWTVLVEIEAGATA